MDVERLEFTFANSELGSATRVDVDDAGFSRAVRVEVRERTKKAWDAQVRSPGSQIAIAEGDRLFVAYSARCLVAHDESGEGMIHMHLQKAQAPWVGLVGGQRRIGKTWRRFNAHAVALTDDGRVLVWGDNARGQLGDGSTTGTDVPIEVTGVGTPVSLAADMHDQAVDDGEREGQPQREAGAVMRAGPNLDLAAHGLDVLAHHAHAHAPPGNTGDLRCCGKAGMEDQLIDVLVAHVVTGVDQALADRLRQEDQR